MGDLVYFQINQDSGPLRYFGLKEDEKQDNQVRRDQFELMLTEFGRMLEYLKEKNIIVHDNVQINGKLL